MIMQVTDPNSPHGSVQHSANINNNNNSSGDVFIDNDVLLFEFTNDRGDNDTVSVDLFDDQSNGPINGASGSVTWSGGMTGTQYIEFRGFPTRADGSVMDSCNYTATLTNNDDNNAGTELMMNIYRG
jgi:hypothetical protein